MENPLLNPFIPNPQRSVLKQPQTWEEAKVCDEIFVNVFETTQEMEHFQQCVFKQCTFKTVESLRLHQRFGQFSANNMQKRIKKYAGTLPLVMGSRQKRAFRICIWNKAAWGEF